MGFPREAARVREAHRTRDHEEERRDAGTQDPRNVGFRPLDPRTSPDKCWR